MTRDDGGPAFPRPLSNGVLIDHAGKSSQVDVLPQCGMSLQDYFAAKALPSTLSASASGDGCYDYVAAAIGAYQVADAMIAERSKPTDHVIDAPASGWHAPICCHQDDVRLIIAAPDLLAALKALFADYKALADSGDSGFWHLEDEPVGQQALAAIAKAEGAK